MIVRPNGKSGYFASNRPGGLGKDDVYRWETKEPVFYMPEKEVNAVTLFALDKLSLEPIAGATVHIYPLTTDLNQFTLSEYNLQLLEGSAEGDLILRISPQKMKETDSQPTDEEGKSGFLLPAYRQYYLRVEKEGYANATLLYDAQVLGDSIHLLLEPTGSLEDSLSLTSDENGEEIVDSDNLPFADGNSLILDNIYYDYNSSNIVSGAATELDSLASWLTAHPQQKIQLVAHTDSRGSADYNMQLSVNRAMAARNYLTKAGVDENRIDIRGMGEKSLRNHCKNGVACTEKQHRFNRRTEVVLLGEETENE
jgi:outer membrane protein OmpA-like peptidoglycan-associated protein